MQSNLLDATCQFQCLSRAPQVIAGLGVGGVCLVLSFLPSFLFLPPLFVAGQRPATAAVGGKKNNNTP